MEGGAGPGRCATQWAGTEPSSRWWAGPCPAAGGARLWHTWPALGGGAVWYWEHWEYWKRGGGETGAGSTGRWVLVALGAGCEVLEPGFRVLGVLGAREMGAGSAGCSSAGELGVSHWGAGTWGSRTWVLGSGCCVLGAGWPGCGKWVGKPCPCRGMFHISFALKREIEQSQPHKATAGLQAGLLDALGTAPGHLRAPKGTQEQCVGRACRLSSGRASCPHHATGSHSTHLPVPIPGEVHLGAGSGLGPGSGVARAVCRPWLPVLGSLRSTPAPAAEGFAQAQARLNKQLPAPSSPAAALLHLGQRYPGTTA